MNLEMELKNTRRSSYAVTEALALIIVIMIATSSVSFIVFWGIPFMEQKKESVRADSALTQLQTINDVIQEVSGKGINGSGMVDFVTDAGQLSISSSGERFIFYYSLVEGFDFNISRFNDNNDMNCMVMIEADLGGLFDHFWIRYLYDETQNEEAGIMASPGHYNITTSNYPLSDAIQITINTTDDQVIGHIWLFDSGSISYKMSAGTGTYQMIAENGGVVSMLDNNGYLAYEPTIHHKDDSLVMQIIQLKSGEAISGGSTKSATFLIKSNASYVRASKATIPASFKMQIYGDHSEQWKNYFKVYHNFNQDGDMLCLNNIRSFTLVHSICDVSVVG